MDIRETISSGRTFLMGLAMIAVVCFHHGWVVIPVFTAFFSRFGLWGVDIFLFVSGFGCVYALKKYSKSEFLKRRVKRLLPTCLLVGVIIILFDLYYQTERTHAPFVIRLLSLHRWYIQAILIAYLVCPFAYWLIKKYDMKALIAMFVVMIVAERLLPEHTVYKLNWICERLPVFMVGIYIAEKGLKVTKVFVI